MTNQRSYKREIDEGSKSPIKFYIRENLNMHAVEMVNFHYQGACLKIENPTLFETITEKPETCLIDFFLGKENLQKDIPFEVCWRGREEGLVGIKFSKKLTGFQNRNQRFLTQSKFKPQISCADPLDANRKIFFEAIDLSDNGMLLRTSLSNRHLFPGMKLKSAILTLPGQPALDVDLMIENARPTMDKENFLLGVSLAAGQKEYLKSLRQHLSYLPPILQEPEKLLESLSSARFLDHKIKGAVTYKNVTSEEDYIEVLKLRFMAYGKHEKVKPGTTWKEQGEGLENEGLIIAGSIGGIMVCTMELRFGNQHKFRTHKILGLDSIPGISNTSTLEVNKLAIHPKAQGTDIVLGLIQKVHAIVTARGHWDVLLTATDKLVPLYERIGARKLNLSGPHPFLINTPLNALVVRKETYLDGFNLNPFAWTMIYQASNEYFANWGISKNRELTRKDKFVKALSGKLIHLKNTKKEKRKDAGLYSLVKPNEVGKGEYIDPIWTRQDIAANVMNPYILEADAMIGSEKVDEILSGIGIPRSYFLKESNWLSIEFHDRFLEKFSQHGNALTLSKRAGIRSFKRDVMGVNYYFLKHFLTPDVAFNAFAKITPRFNRTRTYSVSHKSKGKVIVDIGIAENHQMPARRESCDNWAASFEAYIELMTGEPGKVEKIACCYNGDKACRYEIRWKNHSRRRFYHWGTSLSSASLVSFGLSQSGFYTTASLAESILSFSLFAVCVNLFIQNVLLKRENDESRLNFEKYVSEVNEKYKDLQNAKINLDRRYHEAKLLERTSQDIQKTTHFQKILKTSLDAICSTFDFDRTFAMILNKQNSRLETTAISGLDANLDPLWKFTVDVSIKRENSQLLSSVYHSGSSILINDIDKHLFQLNQESQNLIKLLQTRGFAIVAIPAQNGTWGVIVADKIQADKKIDRRDLVILERLAQQLGLALDKEGQLESEKNQRLLFQKYVPADIVSLVSNEKNLANLDGVHKEISCMFLDIRNFTRLSSSFPSKTIVRLLNELFTAVDIRVRESGGIIEKYLGDGVLATWGAFTDGNKGAMLECPIKILSDLKELNKVWASERLPIISVGMGFHTGTAIVGSIGSDKRAELTSIGTTVNVASRLESLCKELETKICLSDAVFQKFSPHLHSSLHHWQKKSNVQVRGVSQALDVYIYKEDADQESSNPFTQKVIAS